MLPSPTVLTPDGFVAHRERLRALNCTSVLDRQRLLVRTDRPFDPDVLPDEARTCLSKQEINDAARFDARRRWEVSRRREQVADRICPELELDRLLLNLPGTCAAAWSPCCRFGSSALRAPCAWISTLCLLPQNTDAARGLVS